MRDSTILTRERVVGAKAIHAVVAKWAETRPPWNNTEEALLVYAALCRQLEMSARAYQELLVCYWVGKRPTERLFTALEKANATRALMPTEGENGDT